MKQSWFGQKKQDQEEDQFSTKLQATKEKQITPETRVVLLKYEACCGCGCADLTVKRTVPFDSKLQSGDRIKEMEKNDEMID